MTDIELELAIELLSKAARKVQGEPVVRQLQWSIEAVPNPHPDACWATATAINGTYEIHEFRCRIGRSFLKVPDRGRMSEQVSHIDAVDEANRHHQAAILGDLE
jgi:hypothetical protein